MSNHLDFLPLADARSIEEACTAFEQRGEYGVAAIEFFLKDCRGEHRAALFQELLLLDAELRTARGEQVTASDYEFFTNPSDIQAALRILAENKATSSPESDRYSFECELGRGGIGAVWRVYDRVSERPLAIKILHEQYRKNTEARSRLLNEALLTGKLQHPGIPPVFDRGFLPSGLAYFSMKLVDGETFESILCRREYVEDDFALCIDVFRQVAQTLAYAHQHSVIHRDLKPHNIMVGRFGEVQVMDWGMAKPLSDNEFQRNAAATMSSTSSVSYGDSEADSTIPISAHLSGESRSGNLTLDGSIVGTPVYMAPEQARGEIANVDARTDVFGLGAILFQILTYRRLYEDETSHEIIAKSARGDLSEAYAQLNAILGRPALVDLCRQCLSVDPANRPPNAGEVAEAVGNYLAGVEAQLRQTELERERDEVQRAELRKRQRIFNWMASAVVAVAILGAAAFAWEWNQSRKLAVAEGQARILAESEASTVAEVNSFLGLLLSSARPERFGTEVTVAEIIDAMVPELQERFADKPGVEGDIRLTIGLTYRSLGYDHDAVEQLRMAVACLERVRPRDELKQLVAKHELAGMLRSRNADPSDLAEAVTLRTEVLERRTELLGPTHPDTVEVMNSLGLVYWEQGDLAKAEGLIGRALELLSRDPKAPLDAYLAFKNNLMLIREDSGDYETAEAGYRELLKLHGEREHNKESLNIMGNLAVLLDTRGKTAEAEQLYHATIAGRTEYYGATHPVTLSAGRKLSRMLVSSGQYDTALPVLQELLEKHVIEFGADAGLTFSVRQYLARALIGLSRNEEAQAVLEETLEILARGRGNDHEYTEEAREQLEAYLKENSAVLQP